MKGLRWKDRIFILWVTLFREMISQDTTHSLTEMVQYSMYTCFLCFYLPWSGTGVRSLLRPCFRHCHLGSSYEKWRPGPCVTVHPSFVPLVGRVEPPGPYRLSNSNLGTSLHTTVLSFSSQCCCYFHLSFHTCFNIPLLPYIGNIP